MALELTPVKLTDIAVGKPLRWPVFDQHRKLLLRNGYMVETQAQVDQLIARGIFRPVVFRRAAVSMPQPEEEEEDGTRAARAPADEGPTLESLRPEIGSSVQLQSASEDNKDAARFYVRLIGYLPGATVIVTTPQVEEKYVLVRDGQAYIFRGFHGTSAFAFATHVLKVNNAPTPYLHLAYPKLIQGITVRKSTRVRTHIIASVSPSAEDPEGPTLAAQVIDMSFTGCALEAPRALGAVGDPMTLAMRLKLDGPEAYVVLQAVIRSVRPAANSPREMIFHGIEFVSMAPADRLALQNLVMSKIIAGEQAG